MNKKYVLFGVLFWAAVSGYMAVRILDSYTEDAVAAALSGIPATAEEISFSLLNKTLSISGLEYDIPNEKVQRKGRIERIEVQDFNRKILFVMPRMAEYSPETLPMVAERVTVSGWKDTLHEKEEKIESSAAQVSIVGWHQRLGLVLDQYARYGAGKRFFEEMLRCRMEHAEVAGLSVAKGGADPGMFSVSRIVLPRGVIPPAAGEKTHPLDITLENAAFSHGGLSASAGRAGIQNALLPGPESLEALRTAAQEAGSGKAVRNSFAAALLGAYENRLPFSSFSLSSASCDDSRGSGKIRMDECSVMLSRSGNDCGIDVTVRALKGTSDGLRKSLPYLPDGQLAADAKIKASAGNGGAECTASCVLPGLGGEKFNAVVKGNVKDVLKSLLQENSRFSMKSFAALRIQEAELSHADDGLAALLLRSEAKEKDCLPEELLTQYQQAASALASGKNVLQAEIGRILTEQLEHPGKMSVKLQKEMGLPSLVMALFMSPEKLPLAFSSEPGGKSLRSLLGE